MKLDRVIAVRTNKTVYREGNTAIKVFDSDFSKADVLNEALNQAHIEQTGLRIPSLLAVTTIEGKWAIINDYIKGKTLEQLLRENPGKAEEYLDLFVELQMQIHAKTSPRLTRLKDRMKRKIEEANLIATIRYALHARLGAMPDHCSLCHGDFNPSNIIVSENGLPYILDWAHATQGDAPADAAKTYLCLALSGDVDVANEYLSLFCKKSDTAKQCVEQWMPIVAASQLVKGNAKEREFLLSLVNVVDYQ